jgi:hypothetical protein
MIARILEKLDVSDVAHENFQLVIECPLYFKSNGWGYMHDC